MTAKWFILACFICSFQVVFSSENTSDFQWKSAGFSENKGQLMDQHGKPSPEVKYMYSHKGFNIQLKTSGFSYEVSYQEQKPAFSEAGPFVQELAKNTSDGEIRKHRIDIHFVGSNPNPVMIQENILPGYSNYYTASIPVLNVHTYQKIIYKNLYPNIDLAFYLKGEQPEYDFILHPGADPRDIQLIYEGMNAMSLDDNGNLSIDNTFGTISESITESYQQEDHQSVAVSYQVNHSAVSFDVRKYNKNKTLIIDPVPVLLWGRYFAGANGDWGNNVVVDSKNNNVMVGTTFSNAVATSGAHQTVLKGTKDAFIARFNVNGVLLWATYYGGTNDEQGNNIALDANDNILICGFSYSTSGITTAGAYNTVLDFGTNGQQYSDAFVSKFDSTGVLLWGTYYGGEGDDQGWGLTLDQTGNVVMVGYTLSFNDIASAGAYQTASNLPGNGDPVGFIVKLDPTGTTRQWGTYYGAVNNIGTCCADVAVDSGNRIIVMGCTDSHTFIASAGTHQPIYGGGFADAFVAAFNPNGTRIWGTYFGGNGDENSFSSVSGNPYLFPDFYIDSGNNIVITGSTSSTNGIASAGAFQTTYGGSVDAFIAKLDATGNLVWGTYYGGSGQDFGESVFIDKTNNIYVVGGTASNNNIGTLCAHQDSLSITSTNTLNTFIAEFTSTGTKVWGTYEASLGAPIGTSNVGTSSGDGIAVNSLNTIIVAGGTNAGSIASNMLSTPFDGTVNGASAFLTAFIIKTPTIPVITGPSTYCFGGSQPVLSTNTEKSYVWTDVTTSKNVAVTQSYTAVQPGTYKVSITSDTFSCVLTSANFVLKEFAPFVTVSDSGRFCSGDSAMLVSSKGLSYQWSTGALTQSIYVKTAGNYTVAVKDTSGSGCIATIQSSITKVSLPVVSLGNDTTLCAGASTIINLNIPGATYLWTGGTVKSSFTINKPGIYKVAVTEYPCAAVVDSIIVKTPPAPVITGPATFCLGGTAPVLKSSPAKSYVWKDVTSSQNLGTTSTITPTQPGTYEVSILSDTFSCALTSSAFILKEFVPVVTVSDSGKFCSGDSVMLSSSKGLSYQWSTSALTQSIYVKAGGNYSVAVEDTSGSGCIANVQSSVTKITPPIVFLGNDTTLCAGASTTINLNIPGATYLWSDATVKSSYTISKPGIYKVAVTEYPCAAVHDSIVVTTPPAPIITGPSTFCFGGTPPVLKSSPAKSYVWKDITSSQNIGTTPTISPTQPGTYEVSILSDTFSCALTSSAFILKEFVPVVTVSDSGKFCSGDSVMLASSKGLSYQWSTNAVTQSIYVKTAGNYTVAVKDTSGSGCIANVQSSISKVTPPVVSLGNDTTLCAGASTTINLNIPDASYLWSDGTSKSSYTINKPGVYKVAVTEFPCAAVSDSIIVRAPSIPVISGPSRFCPGSAPSALKVSKGKSYLWTDLTTSQTVDTSQIFIPTLAGTYEVSVVSDTFPCTLNSAPFSVQAIIPVITATDSGKVCSGDTTILKSSKGLSYLWSTGDTTRSIQVTKAGVFSVTVKDTSGCISSSNADSIKGVVPPTVFLGNDTTLCEGSTKTIQLKIPHASYLWSDGSVKSSFTINKQGVYFVTVSEYPCAAVSDSIKVKYINDIEYTIANLITYNHDDLNDCFLILNMLSDTHVEIFNRWGSCVFKSKNYENNWCPDNVSDGVYFYHVSNDNSCVRDYKGWVEVVR